MQVSLKEEYKGQLALKFDQANREFYYILGYREYPKYDYQEIEIEEGDELTVRSPLDGSVLIHRIVEFDYDSFKQMNLETGSMHQMVAMQPIRGIMKNIEPNYWFNCFAQNYPADLTKKV